MGRLLDGRKLRIAEAPCDYCEPAKHDHSASRICLRCLIIFGIHAYVEDKWRFNQSWAFDPDGETTESLIKTWIKLECQRIRPAEREETGGRALAWYVDDHAPPPKARRLKGGYD